MVSDNFRVADDTDAKEQANTSKVAVNRAKECSEQPRVGDSRWTDLRNVTRGRSGWVFQTRPQARQRDLLHPGLSLALIGKASGKEFSRAA
jgi:hypothetical protein